ncbi:MAG: hypothetical protein ACERKD_16115 [Prolixibacteraceae bacterium]
MGSSSLQVQSKKWIVSSQSLKRAIKVAMVVGIILNLINNPGLFSWSFTGLTISKVLLTFLVPFCVSLYSSILANRSNCQE